MQSVQIVKINVLVVFITFGKFVDVCIAQSIECFSKFFDHLEMEGRCSGFPTIVPFFACELFSNTHCEKVVLPDAISDKYRTRAQEYTIVEP